MAQFFTELAETLRETSRKRESFLAAADRLRSDQEFGDCDGSDFDPPMFRLQEPERSCKDVLGLGGTQLTRSLRLVRNALIEHAGPLLRLLVVFACTEFMILGDFCFLPLLLQFPTQIL